MAYVSTSPIASAPLLGRVSAQFATARQAFTDYRLYRKTVEELQVLEARELADLGIYRGEIRSVARKAVYGN